MRYWIKGEDEDHDRQRKLSLHLGTAPPSRSGGLIAAAGFLAAVQIALWVTLAALAIYFHYHSV